MLGKLTVPGRPANLDDSRARAYCACSRRGWGLFGHFFSHLSFLSPSIWETARLKMKYCLKGPLNPKEPTNQPLNLKKGLRSPKTNQGLVSSNRYTLVASLEKCHPLAQAIISYF